MPLPSYDDPGPLLTLAEVTALHARSEAVAWFVVPGPDGGVIARAHTEAHDGGHLLLGHLAAGDLTGCTPWCRLGWPSIPRPRVGRCRGVSAGGGADQLPKVVQGVTFRNGVEVTDTPAQSAA